MVYASNATSGGVKPVSTFSRMIQSLKGTYIGHVKALHENNFKGKISFDIFSTFVGLGVLTSPLSLTLLMFKMNQTKKQTVISEEKPSFKAIVSNPFDLDQEPVIQGRKPESMPTLTIENGVTTSNPFVFE